MFLRVGLLPGCWLLPTLLVVPIYVAFYPRLFVVMLQFAPVIFTLPCLVVALTFAFVICYLWLHFYPILPRCWVPHHPFTLVYLRCCFCIFTFTLVCVWLVYVAPLPLRWIFAQFGTVVGLYVCCYWLICCCRLFTLRYVAFDGCYAFGCYGCCRTFYVVVTLRYVAPRCVYPRLRCVYVRTLLCR